MSNLIKSGFSSVRSLRSLTFFGINYFKTISDINAIYRWENQLNFEQKFLTMDFHP